MKVSCGLSSVSLLHVGTVYHPGQKKLLLSYSSCTRIHRKAFARLLSNLEVDRLSKGLMALDIAKGDHVVVWAPNMPEWIFLQSEMHSEMRRFR